MKSPSAIDGQRRGSTLLLVLWAVMLMSFAVIGLVKYLSRGVDESIHEEKDFRARLLLESARVVAAHPAISRGDPLLRQAVSSVSSYEITLTTEGSRVALNQIAASWAHLRLATQLFERWGMDARQARALAESIADWIDPDDRPRPQGAEKDYYMTLDRPDFPFNRPFENINDLLLVRGAAEMERLRPNWRDSFTLYGDGKIDVHTAPGELLEVLFNVTPTEIAGFLRARAGVDGLPDTEDDPRFKTLQEVRNLLSVPASSWRIAEPLLTLEHPIKRTECLARVGNLERRMIVIVGGGLNIIKEE